jgi:hypothetical protein
VQEGCGYKDTLQALATLLHQQNISLCALLISRPSYIKEKAFVPPLYKAMCEKKEKNEHLQ